jgi:hypothetical protein
MMSLLRSRPSRRCRSWSNSWRRAAQREVPVEGHHGARLCLRRRPRSRTLRAGATAEERMRGPADAAARRIHPRAVGAAAPPAPPAAYRTKPAMDPVLHDIYSKETSITWPRFAKLPAQAHRPARPARFAGSGVPRHSHLERQLEDGRGAPRHSHHRAAQSFHAQGFRQRPRVVGCRVWRPAGRCGARHRQRGVAHQRVDRVFRRAAERCSRGCTSSNRTRYFSGSPAMPDVGHRRSSSCPRPGPSRLRASPQRPSRPAAIAPWHPWRRPPPARSPAPTAGAGRRGGEFDHEIANIYSEEATELLEAAEASLNAWNRDRKDKERVAELQRQLHTLKGGARMAGITAMGDLSHELETLVIRSTAARWRRRSCACRHAGQPR